MFQEDRSIGAAQKPKEPPEPWMLALLMAAALLRRRGWCQNAYMDNGGRYCVAGAIGNVTQGNNALWGETMKKLTQFLSFNAPTWNDRPGRTADEAIAALEDCAKKP